MSETLQPKGKGPKAVIELEPASETDELLEAGQTAAEGDDASAEEAPGDGQEAIASTMGFLKRLGVRIWNYSEENPNTVFYTLVGLVFAILILVLGIWRALVIGVCMAVGAIYGQVRDGKNGIVNFFIDLIEGNGK